MLTALKSLLTSAIWANTTSLPAVNFFVGSDLHFCWSWDIAQMPSWLQMFHDFEGRYFKWLLFVFQDNVLLFVLGSMLLLLLNNTGADRRIALWILCAGKTHSFSAYRLVFPYTTRLFLSYICIIINIVMNDNRVQLLVDRLSNIALKLNLLCERKAHIPIEIYFWELAKVQCTHMCILCSHFDPI